MRVFLLSFLFIYILFANEEVTIQLKWKYQFQFAGFIMAKEKGFYKKEGLNVHLREIDNNTNIVNYVLNNPNSYGVGDSGLISDILHKKPIVLLMPIYENSPFVLTAINLDEIKTLKDIQKHNIVLDQFAIKNPAILSMLKSQNIDINKLNVKKQNFYKDIHQKGVFAFYESNEIYTLKKNHIPYKIFNPKDYGLNFYGDILFTSKKESELHHKRVKKIIEATKKGFIYAFNHIDETIDIILKKYNTQNLTKEKLLFEANILRKYINYNFQFNLDKLDGIKNVYILLGEKSKVDISDYIYTPLQLTKKEKEFIKSHIIKNITTSSWEPFNLMKNGKLDGIAIDYWKYIKKETNLKAECFVTDSWSEVLENIKTKQKDMTCSTTITPDRVKYAIFSKPYVSFPIVVATRNDVGFINDISLLKDKTIAVGKNYTAETLLKKHYPYLKLLEVKNTDEALKMVSEGKVYGAVDILPVIAYKINKYHFTNLKISGKTPWTFDVRFMVRDDYPELVSIINKVIDIMPQTKKDEIYQKWISVKVQKGYSKSYIIKIVVISIGIIIIILLLVVYLVINIVKKKKLEEELERLATIDKLTSIFNRYKIDMALNEQIEVAKRYKRPMSIIFFDIDHFKEVNDTYGHKKGDFVLIELAKVINQNIRKSDIFGRWGGEEFLLILPETRIDKAEKLAEKLRKIVENHDFDGLSITISLGVTELKENDNISSLMGRVDKLLYKAKENGRNQVSVG